MPELSSLTPFSRRAIDLIVIHCSATANAVSLYSGTPGQRGYRTPLSEIDGWHAERAFQRSAPESRTFNAAYQHVGYHYIVGRDGTVQTGRHPSEAGAHVAGHNAMSLGICLVGIDRYTPEQWATLADLVKALCNAYKVPMARPRRNGKLVTGGVCGHRDLSPDLNGDGAISQNEWCKTCPGFDVGTWLDGGRVALVDRIFPPPGASA